MRPQRLTPLGILTGMLIAATAFAGAQQYTHPKFSELTQTHKSVAILPFKVTFNMKNMPKNTTPEMLDQAARDEASEFQRQLYARFLQRANDGEYSVEFQDVDQTNALLTRAGITPDSLAGHTRDEVARILGVDALISGTIHQSRPTSTGTAIATNLIFGFGGSTERVDITMLLHNGVDGALLWSYDHNDKGGLSDSPEAMTKSLLKKVAGNFPYRKSIAAKRTPAEPVTSK